MEQHPHRRPTPCTAQSRAEQLRTAQPQASRTVHVVENFDDFAGNAETLPVLMYHYVYTEDDPPEKEDANYLLDTKLAAQLQYLVDNNYYYPSYAEVRAFAYPYGDNNENAWAAMEEAGVLCAFTIENRRVEVGDPVEALPRVRIAGEYTQEGFEHLVEPNGGEQ